MLALADALAIVGLHAAGGPPWPEVDWTAVSSWAQRSPDDVALAGLRLLALAMAYWLAAAIVTGLVSHLRHRRPRPAWYEIPAVRSLVERAVVIGVTVTATASALAAPPLSRSAVAAEDGAAPLPPIPVVVEQPIATDTSAPGSTELPSVGSVPVPPMPAPDAPLEPRSPEIMRSPAVATVPREQADDYVVQPGDSLWSIAANRLTALRGEPPCESEVAAYWVALIDANRAKLRSGDPDLIYPGEHVELVAAIP